MLGLSIALKIIVGAILLVYLGILLLWSSGAFYFDVGQRGFTGWICLLIWAAVFGTILIAVKPFWLAVVIVSANVAFLGIWSALLKPSHDREWDPNFAKLPEFIVDGDRLTVKNIRNTSYRTLKDYDVRYETREYRLSDLKAVDALMLFWGSDSVSHPMVIFDFGNDQHLCISIEVRYRINEPYEMLRSLYRQNELLYLVTDERDAILRRTKYSENHDCYLYRLQNSAEENHEFLMEYIRETNSILEKPRWYNVITANCTTTIYRQRGGKAKWDSRILFNGKFDEMLYERGRLYQGLSFDELKAESWINDRANNADPETFSKEIRNGLPGFE